MARKKLVIFPCNGNAIEALDCISPEEYDLLGFIDDDAAKKCEGYTIYSRNVLSKFEEIYVLAVPGSPSTFKLRSGIIRSLGIAEDRYITVVHPKACLGKNVKLGFNTLIMAGVVLTSNAVVGNHVCILPNSVVHHDSLIDDYSLIGSNVVIAGGCTVGRGCYIGSGSTVINGVTIGSFALVGLGTNVIRDVDEDAKVVGNPGRDLNVHLV